MCIEFLRAQNRQTPWNIYQRYGLNDLKTQPFETTNLISNTYNSNSNSTTLPITTSATQLSDSTKIAAINEISDDFEGGLPPRLSSMSQPLLDQLSEQKEKTPLDLMFEAAARGEDRPALVALIEAANDKNNNNSPVPTMDSNNNDDLLKKVSSAPDIIDMDENLNNFNGDLSIV